MLRNILLAEDDRVTALMVKTQLEAKGYWVHTAADGIEALKVLSSKSIDLIITDVVMPRMDGVDLYEAIKKNPQTADLPIIIVTDKAVFKESFESLGVSNFVEKTSNISVLLEKIISIQKYNEEKQKYPKILVTGSHRIVLDQMTHALSGMKYQCVSAHSSDEIMSKTLSLTPKAVVLDVLFQDRVSAPELIRSLRCFNFLRNTKVVTYAYFPEDLGMNVEAVKSVEEAMEQCAQAGSDQYIGRFNQGFFLEKLIALGI